MSRGIARGVKEVQRVLTSIAENDASSVENGLAAMSDSDLSVEARSSSGKLFTSTNRSNTPMRKLCDRLGFQPSGVVENLDNHDPELVYYKRLEAGP